MSFTYGPTEVPPVWDPMRDAVRALVADTDISNPIWLDEEIAGMVLVQAGMYQGRNLPVSPLRVAALLLNALASNQARLSNVTRLLDVTLTPVAVKELRAQAQAYIDQDDNCGIVVIQQATTSFAFRDLLLREAERRSGA
jgi:hypothetical protein